MPVSPVGRPVKRVYRQLDLFMPDGTLAYVGQRWQLEGTRPPRDNFGGVTGRWERARRNIKAVLANRQAARRRRNGRAITGQ